MKLFDIKYSECSDILSNDIYFLFILYFCFDSSHSMYTIFRINYVN